MSPPGSPIIRVVLTDTNILINLISRWPVGPAWKTASIFLCRPGRGRKGGDGFCPDASSPDSHVLGAATGCSTCCPCGIEGVCRSRADPGIWRSRMFEPGRVPAMARRFRRKKEIPPRNAGPIGNGPPAEYSGYSETCNHRRYPHRRRRRSSQSSPRTAPLCHEFPFFP